MTSNVYDFEKIKRFITLANEEKGTSPDNNLALLMRGLEKPSQRLIFEGYVERLTNLSHELKALSTEFDNAVNQIIQDEIRSQKN